MNKHSHLRVDRGLKRKHKGETKAIWSDAKRNPKARAMTIYSPEIKAAAMADAIQGLVKGEKTDVIAARHGIPGRTLRGWLLVDENAREARAVMLGYELAARLDEFDVPEDQRDPIALAYARESFRAWSWTAERTAPQLFGVKHEVTVNHNDLGERLRRPGRPTSHDHLSGNTRTSPRSSFKRVRLE
jgi:hypothetical protein